MTTKKDLVIVILATFCLTLTLFTILPTHSSSSTATLEYDPWEDIDGDGKITLYDAVSLLNSYGAEGDPTRNVTVTNFPLDEYGNLRISLFGIFPSPHNYSQKITVFSTQANLPGSPNDYYFGGTKLDPNSMFAFSFEPLGTPFNITEIYVSLVMFADRGSTISELSPTRVWVTINGQTEYHESDCAVDIKFLTVLSIKMTNSSLTGNICSGVNTMQVTAQSWRENALTWMEDVAYEISVLIAYQI